MEVYTLMVAIVAVATCGRKEKEEAPALPNPSGKDEWSVIPGSRLVLRSLRPTVKD